jgi:hypothetical protein
MPVAAVTAAAPAVYEAAYPPPLVPLAPRIPILQVQPADTCNGLSAAAAATTTAATTATAAAFTASRLQEQLDLSPIDVACSFRAALH